MNQKLLAQLSIGGETLQGPLDPKFQTLGDLVNALLPFVISLAGIVLFLILIWGGYDFMMSQGSAEKMKSGKAKITAGIIGFILLLSSYLITKLIAYIFNVGNGIL